MKVDTINRKEKKNSSTIVQSKRAAWNTRRNFKYKFNTQYFS